MVNEINREIESLKNLLDSLELDREFGLPAMASEIDAAESATGIQFDADLRSLWSMVNGTGSTACAVMTDELTGCSLTSIEQALEAWSWFSDIDEVVPEEWTTEKPTDCRNRQGRLHHRKWFPIVEFNGFSTAVYFDADPAPSGRYGQIIAYQHDPDAVFYVASGVAEFLKTSNELLRKNITRVFFMEDEYERICHISGLAELKRQLAGGIDINRPNLRGDSLRDAACREGRSDIVEFLDVARG